METAGNRLTRGPGIRVLGCWLIGAVVWLFCLHASWGTALQWELAAGAIVAGSVPAVRRSLSAGLERIREPSPTARWRTAVLISIGASALFVVIAYAQAWDFILRYEDEHSYVIAIQMMARGKLWMPALPAEVADFFSAFALFTSPTYGSMYFPGTALMFAPTIWLHLPWWALPVLVAGACVGFSYRIITELTDGVIGLLAALMIAALPSFRSLSLMLLSQSPTLLLGLILIWAWLRWRRQRRAIWTVVIGGAAGWMLVTRPLDALAYIVPVGCAIVLDLIEARTRFADAARTFALIIVASSPFLAIELLQNRAMTGHWLQSPNEAYADANYPAPVVGFHAIGWNHVPIPKLAEDRELIEDSFWPGYRAHQLRLVPQTWWNERLPRTLAVTLPSPLLAMLIPAGILGLRDRRRRVLAGITLLFCALYACSVSYQAHYIMVIVPGVAMMTLLGLEQLKRLWPGQWAMIALVVAALSIGAMAQTDAINWSPWMDLVRIENKLATLPPEPAVVLFRYHPKSPAINIAHHQPVYNTDTPWPDDAQIIRAHDLGAENIRLFQYYARTQPGRVIYLYDRDGDTVTRLGTAAEAARSYNDSLRSSNHGG